MMKMRMTMAIIFSKKAMTVSSDVCSHNQTIKKILSLHRAINLNYNLCPPLTCSPGPSIQSKMVSNQQMDNVAAKLGAQWKTLATHLEMKAAEMREIENDSEDEEMQAKLLLVAWQDREGSQATVETLITALNAAGFSQIAETLSEE